MASRAWVEGRGPVAGVISRPPRTARFLTFHGPRMRWSGRAKRDAEVRIRPPRRRARTAGDLAQRGRGGRQDAAPHRRLAGGAGRSAVRVAWAGGRLAVGHPPEEGRTREYETAPRLRCGHRAAVRRNVPRRGHHPRRLRPVAPPGQLALTRPLRSGADRQLHGRGPPDAGFAVGLYLALRPGKGSVWGPFWWGYGRSTWGGYLGRRSR